ncbi:MAG: FKBP-type peptidyl-prolyl cis-trans isomerase [Bacteroidota bacterium]|nr:FKBP-type peptidyl-prolyl cis-trans isomerase [Bacteroidota bacterium]
MKKQWFACLLSGLLFVTFLSCSSDDTQWRDENIAYMGKIAKQEGIKQLGDSINGFSGIYYQVLRSGDTTTARPVIGNVVRTVYKCYLYNDTTAFDSNDNYKSTVGKSIDGFDIALQYMHVGDYWKLYIPYNLAYGTSGTTSVPAYSMLVYYIYLKEIVSEN